MTPTGLENTTVGLNRDAEVLCEVEAGPKNSTPVGRKDAESSVTPVIRLDLAESITAKLRDRDQHLWHCSRTCAVVVAVGVSLVVAVWALAMAEVRSRRTTTALWTRSCT